MSTIGRSVIRGLAVTVSLLTLCALAPSVSLADTAQDVGYGPGGEVRATMYSSGWGSPDAGTGTMRLVITRDGRRKVNFFPRSACEYCGLFANFRDAVRVVQLNRSNEPEVIFNIYSGGAHCCTSSIIFQYRQGRYRASQKFWGNGFYQVRNIRGITVFAARDDRFAYRFDCYACSRYPIAFWRLTDRGLVDVTRSFPRQVRRDANKHRRVWRIRAPSGRAAAPLAAWLADRCMLGRCRQGWRTVYGVARSGGVSMYYGGRKDYLRKLRRTLRRLGYTG